MEKKPYRFSQSKASVAEFLAFVVPALISSLISANNV